MGYPLDHPVLARALAGLDGFTVHEETEQGTVRWLEACQSPVWDTAIAAYALAQLGEVPGLRVFGPAANPERLGPVSFELDGVHAHDVSEILDRHGVAVRAGHHCAQVLMERLGITATARASFGVYTTTTEIDRLVDGLEDARRVFGL